MVLGTSDEDGCTRTSPVYVVPAERGDLDSTVPPGPDQQAVYVAGIALEVQPAALAPVTE